MRVCVCVPRPSSWSRRSLDKRGAVFAGFPNRSQRTWICASGVRAQFACALKPPLRTAAQQGQRPRSARNTLAASAKKAFGVFAPTPGP